MIAGDDFDTADRLLRFSPRCKPLYFSFFLFATRFTSLSHLIEFLMCFSFAIREQSRFFARCFFPISILADHREKSASTTDLLYPKSSSSVDYTPPLLPLSHSRNRNRILITLTLHYRSEKKKTAEAN